MKRIYCDQCGKEISIKKEDLPEYVQHGYADYHLKCWQKPVKRFKERLLGDN